MCDFYDVFACGPDLFTSYHIFSSKCQGGVRKRGGASPPYLPDSPFSPLGGRGQETVLGW